MANELEFGELSAFNLSLINFLGKTMPKDIRNFMQREGNKLSKNIKNAYRSKVKKKTGNIVKGVKRGKAYTYGVGDWQVRVKDQAPHAHLLEHGHEIFVHGANTNKRTRALHIVGIEANKFFETYGADASKFIDELLEEI